MALILLIACNQEQKRYTQQSPEIDTVKKIVANYNARTYDISMYADTSKTYYNSKDKFMTAAETIEYHKGNDLNYSSRGFLPEDQEFEMVTTDEGEVWVNSWLDWQATMAESGTVIDMPIHLTFQFIDGKIVKEIGLYDRTAIVLALQASAAKKDTVVAQIE